ncbi:hypothetical protein EGK75_09060 [Neisseria weixii]|uniref:Uncharacterized protein n=2 Tax=Neisseria weixii TaxID=1853276 RepID=A0A3N4NDD3_9NEIS|nr:hypothetical protein EGK75_09060 [Neisseria weixii]RPD89419.1 hypothetical protein EGK74_04155 [Neisseria weixii]
MRVQPISGIGYIEPIVKKEGNSIEVYFPSYLTQNVAWTSGKYDLRAVLGNVVKTVMSGRVRIEPSVTPLVGDGIPDNELVRRENLSINFNGGSVIIDRNTDSAGGTGTNGKSAYELALDNGFTGNVSAWLESLKGERGQIGLPGSDGRAATIRVGSVTAGENVSVVNSGTEIDAVFDFTLPAVSGGGAPDFNPSVSVNLSESGEAGGRFEKDSDNGAYTLSLSLPEPKGEVPKFAVATKQVDENEPAIELNQSDDGYVLTFGLPKSWGSLGGTGDSSAIAKIAEFEEQLNALTFVQDLDKSATSAFFWHNTSDMGKLTEKNGIFYITSATHLRSFGFPGYGRSAVLKVIVLGAGFYMWELTVPETGVFATRLFRNNKWSKWNIINLQNQSFNPQYHRDAVVAYGSSSIATMADKLKAAIEPYGVNFINKASSGTGLDVVLLAVGAVKPRVKFPDGVIPAKGGGANAEFVFDGKTVSLHNQFLLLQNGVKLLVSGAGGAAQVTPRENVLAYEVDPNYEFPAQPYVISGYENGISIISSGKNDISANRKANDLKVDFDNIIKNLKPALQPRFLVVGQFSNPSYNAEQKNELNAYNRWQKQTYGMRYFDLVAFMQSEECKTAMQSATGAALSSEDEALLAEGCIPVAWSTEGTKAKASHLNDAAMSVVAPKIVQTLVTLGYIGALGSWSSINVPIV